MNNIKIKKIITFLLVMLTTSPFVISCASAKETAISSEEIVESKDEFIIDKGVLTTYNGTSEKLIIPDGVESIADFVFFDKATIKEVVFPDSLKSIGNYAFSGCKSLKSLTFEDNIVSIGNFSFANCVSLQNIYLNSALDSIGELAFWGCDSLKYISVDEDNQKFTSVKGVLFDKEVVKLLLCPPCMDGTYVMPSSVVAVEGYSFSGCDKIKNIKFSENLKTIGDMAFHRCSNLKSLKFGENLQSIGPCAFVECSALKEVTLPKSLLSIGCNAFFGCGSLTDVIILSENLYIDYHAFNNCSKLTIHATEDSGAKKYAMKNNINFRNLQQK